VRRKKMLTSSENASPGRDEELIEVLIAISVIARWLAKKLQTSMKTKGEKHEHTEDPRRFD
jgi:hypothetical protein